MTVINRYIVLVFVVSLCLLLLQMIWREPEGKLPLLTSGIKTSRHTTKFDNNVVTYRFFRRVCYLGKDPEGLDDLPVYVVMLKRSNNVICQRQYRMFKSIYRLRVKLADIILPESMKLGLLNTLMKKANKQSLIFVDNLYSLEAVVFNLARVAIPPVWGNVTVHVRDTVEKARKGCDFCAVAKNTATDTFGMMQSKHAFIVSNAFKIEKYHGLAILKKHHPLLWTQEQFIDTMALILKWFDRVHQESPDDIYRIVYWDLLLKSGVSQMHPHMHLTLGNYKYVAKWNELYYAGMQFSKDHRGSNYWTNLLQLYTSLGLSVSLGNASVIAYLTPIRDYEVIVISQQPCLDFIRLTYFAIRSLIDGLGEASVCMGWVFPKLSSSTQHGDDLPMLFKLVSRGDPVTLQSDISSFDLYGTPNINRDPYKVIKVIRETVEKGAKEKFHFPR